MWHSYHTYFLCESLPIHRSALWHFSHYFFVVKEDLVYMYPSPGCSLLSAACCLQPQPLTPTDCLHVLNVFIGKITDTLAATIVSRFPGNPLCVFSATA